jgi:glycolate oxidase FAD binding subunit
MREALQKIVGDAHARPATAADAIDGVVPALLVRPGDVDELRAVLRIAHDAHASVVARGAGTKLGWGRPPDALQLVVEMTRFDRVLEHAAGDLVVRAEAGVRLSDLERTLAMAGQRLALDPPYDGTLAGLVAANASGPRRLRFGTCRDLLIGITVVLADGTVAKAGGKVVKNVAGYDLGKLFTGSFGTLGVITQVIFRLHPLPADRTLVIAEPATLEAASAAVQSLMHSSLVPSAIEFVSASLKAGPANGAGQGFSLATLFEGVTAGVVAQAEQAASLLRPHGRVEIVDSDSVDARWTPYAADPFAHAAAGLKLSIVPTELASTCGAVLDAARTHSIAASIRAHAASGILYAALGEADPAAHARVVEQLRRTAPVAVLKGSAALKRAVDVWADTGDALPLMQRVKARFDPDRVLAPGRFVGGI